MPYLVAEFLVFDSTPRILDILLALAGANDKVVLYSSASKEIISGKDLRDVAKRPMLQINEVEVFSSKGNLPLVNLQLSPSSEIWRSPDAGDVYKSPRAGKYYDMQSALLWQDIRGFPSHLRVATPTTAEADFAREVAKLLKRLGDIFRSMHVIGSAGLQHSPEAGALHLPLLSVMLDHVWTQEWRFNWYEPAKVIIGPESVVPDAKDGVGSTTTLVAGGLAAIVLDGETSEESEFSRMFLKGRIERYVRPLDEAKGEFSIAGVPLYSFEKQRELIANRLIRPLMPHHVLQSVLSAEFAVSMGLRSECVIALDVHELGAKRFIELVSADASLEISSDEWRVLHVAGWKRAFGLRSDIVEFLCARYFPVED